MRFAILVLLSLPLIVMNASSEDKKDLPRTGKLMEEKLKNSQKLLEGLATNDFDKIKASADELIRISKAAEWIVHKTPQYEVHTNNFRQAAETISKKAKDKNLEGAALAYVDMTMTCIRCHQHTREIRDTNFFLPAQLEE
jgi:hypothetical protein